MRACVLLVLVNLASSMVSAQTRPNILLIVADDLGYADLGVYGGDIRTPNIDALADTGVVFTQFHTAPLCALTRAMLLTGNNNHVAGLGRQGSSPGPVIPGLAGYENVLSDRVGVLPRLLQQAGYRTYMAGKWHLGETADHSPRAAGFSRSFALGFGAGNHFNGVGMREGGSSYWEDGVRVAWPDGAYSTDVYTDKLIAYLEADKGSEQPFFMLAAYTSPHWPLQVPEDELDLYAGRYDMGYDRLRGQRFDSLQRAGIIPSGSPLPPRNDAVAPWADLTPQERRRESRKMELYAAMVDNLDRHVGRLLDYLRANDLYENTLIVFMADNGAAGEDFYNAPNVFRDYLRAHYDNRYANMGRPGSWVSYGPQWAEAGSAPFKRYKGFTTEGGIVAPLIASGPGVDASRRITDVYLTVSDLAPTFLEMAGAAYPADKAPMVGESARAFLSGDAGRVHADDYVTALWHRQFAFVRQGDWKLVSITRPFDERRFELYNVRDDPGETTDLSRTHPEKRAELLELWHQKRREYGIVLPEDL